VKYQLTKTEFNVWAGGRGVGGSLGIRMSQPCRMWQAIVMGSPPGKFGECPPLSALPVITSWWLLGEAINSHGWFEAAVRIGWKWAELIYRNGHPCDLHSCSTNSYFCNAIFRGLEYEVGQYLQSRTNFGRYEARCSQVVAFRMEIYVLWEMLPCRLVYRYQCFGEYCCLHLQDIPRRTRRLPVSLKKPHQRCFDNLRSRT